MHQLAKDHNGTVSDQVYTSVWLFCLERHTVLTAVLVVYDEVA